VKEISIIIENISLEKNFLNEFPQLKKIISASEKEINFEFIFAGNSVPVKKKKFCPIYLQNSFPFSLATLHPSTIYKH
jgi:hypothetical protein